MTERRINRWIQTFTDPSLLLTAKSQSLHLCAAACAALISAVRVRFCAVLDVFKNFSQNLSELRVIREFKGNNSQILRGLTASVWISSHLPAAGRVGAHLKLLNNVGVESTFSRNILCRSLSLTAKIRSKFVPLSQFSCSREDIFTLSGFIGSTMSSTHRGKLAK